MKCPKCDLVNLDTHLSFTKTLEILIVMSQKRRGKMKVRSNLILLLGGCSRCRVSTPSNVDYR